MLSNRRKSQSQTSPLIFPQFSPINVTSTPVITTTVGGNGGGSGDDKIQGKVLFFKLIKFQSVFYLKFNLCLT